jgi:SulP family sulfate permease
MVSLSEVHNSMKKYFFSRKTLLDDIIAGLTLGIESVPDGLASGLLAAVNPIHGVYAYMVGTFTGAFFTNSVFMTVQAPSAMALIVASVPQVRQGEKALESLVALTILTGLFMALMGLLKAGRFLRFVSNSVMTGFITGVGALTILGQLDDLTGYASSGSNRLLKTIDLAFNLNQVDLPTFFVGLATIFLIINLEKTRLKSLGMVAAIFVASLLPPLFNWDSIALVSDIAEIPDRLPWPILPSLGVFPDLILPAFALALVAVVQGAGISQNYMNPDGKYPDPDKDFVGQGIANIFTGFFQGIPVSGSFSATAISVNSGAKTRFANITAGITMAVVLLVFGNLISLLALPSLAGLLIVVGFRIIKPNDVKLVWKIGPVQQAVMLLTFGLTLIVPLQHAVFIGAAFSILMFVIRQSNKVSLKAWTRQPGELPVEQDAPAQVGAGEALVLIPYGSLFFAATQTFEDELPTFTDETRNSVVILNLHQHDDLGSTFLGVLENYADDLREHNSRLMLAEIDDRTLDKFERTGYLEAFGRENIFRSSERVFEAVMEARHQAVNWIAEQEQSTTPAGEDGLPIVL